MFGGRGVNLHAADGIDRRRGRSGLAAAIMPAATGMHLRAVMMMGVRMIAIRLCHQKRFPAARRPLNNIP